MKEPIKVFNQLMADSVDYLLNQLLYSEKIVDIFKRNCRKVREIMISAQIEYFNSDAVEKILFCKFQDRNTKELSREEKTLFNHIIMLSEFSVSGQINLPARPMKDPIIFSGPLGSMTACMKAVASH